MSISGKKLLNPTSSHRAARKPLLDRLLDKFSRVNTVDTVGVLHSSKFAVTAMIFYSMTQQLRLIFRSTPDGKDDGSLHRYFYAVVIDQISADGLDVIVDRRLVVAILALFDVVRFLVFGYLAYQYRQTIQSQRFPSALTKLLGMLTLVSISGLTVLKTEIFISSFRLDQKYWAFIGFIMMTLHLIDIMILLIFSRDYRYVKSNRFQGLSYAYLAHRLIGLFLISVISFSTGETDNYGGKLFINLLNIGMSVSLLVHQTFMLNFYAFGIFGAVFPLADCLYLWESVLGVASLMNPEFTRAANLDFASFVIIPLMVAAINRIWMIYAQRLLNSNIESVTNGRSARIYMQLLYQCKINSTDERKTFQLYSTMAYHTKMCKDPDCICFVIRLKHQQKISEYEKGRDMSEIDMSNKADLHKNQANKTLKDSYTRKENRLYTADTLKMPFMNNTNRFPVPGSQLSHFRDSNLYYYLALKDTLGFNQVIHSIFTKVTSQIQSSFFSIFIDHTAYMLYEYQHGMMALTCLYLFKASDRYIKTRSAYRDYVVNRYIALSKIAMSEAMVSRNQAYTHRLEFLKVFDYRNRLDSTDTDINRILVMKLKLYQALAGKEIDFYKITWLGSELRNRVQDVSLELARLSRVSTRNEIIVKQLIKYDILVLENSYLAKRTKSALEDLQLDNKLVNGGYEYKSRQKSRLNLYDSTNVAIFSNCMNKSLKISKFTSNVSTLFYDSDKELLGASLNKYMPKDIAIVHDTLVSNYLNGYTSSTRREYLDTVMKSGGMP